MTPPALASQWADELAAYAPDLRVFLYEGWAKVKVPITEAEVEAKRAKRAARRKGKPRRNGRGDDIVVGEIEPGPTHDLNAHSDPIFDWPNYINQFDVCITTYHVLRHDIAVARAPPNRPRRQDVEYKILNRPRSPLVTCEWYRVIMDEVQMMGTGRAEFVVFFTSHIFLICHAAAELVLIPFIPGKWFLSFPVYPPLPSPERRPVPRLRTSSAFSGSCGSTTSWSPRECGTEF